MIDRRARDRQLPPGQRASWHWTVEHYGRVPRFKPDTWHLLITGATADGLAHRVTLEDLQAMPRSAATSDLHCARGWSYLDIAWEGVAAEVLLEHVPPTAAATHALVWAEHGYCATVRLDDLRRPGVLLADTVDGAPLPPERGFPLRLVVPHLYGFKGPKWLRGIEYHTEPVQGFWEQRGYHEVAEVWSEQRYSHH